MRSGSRSHGQLSNIFPVTAQRENRGFEMRTCLAPPGIVGAASARTQILALGDDLVRRSMAEI